jgi:hypothetical protein
MLLVACCGIIFEMAGNVTEPRQVEVVGTPVGSVSFHCPSIWDTELDKFGIIVLLINSSGFKHFRGKLLEGASVGTGLLAIDLHLITAKKWGYPVSGSRDERCSSLDVDIGTGMVDRKRPGGDGLRVVSREVSPLQRIFAIGQPVGEGQVVALADLGVAGIEARTITVARVALTLNDCTRRRFD